MYHENDSMAALAERQGPAVAPGQHGAAFSRGSVDAASSA